MACTPWDLDERKQRPLWTKGWEPESLTFQQMPGVAGAHDVVPVAWTAVTWGGREMGEGDMK